MKSEDQSIEGEEGSSGATGMKRLLNYALLLVAVIIAAWGFMGCGKESAPGRPPQAEAPLVRVQKVVEKEITTTKEYIGRVEAVDSVDLVARVSGYLESIDFVEGRYVTVGDLMFTIEKDRFHAEIEARKGSVSQIEANLVEAEKYLRRLQSAREGSVPEKDIEAAQRNVDNFLAQLVSAKAHLDLAEIDLKYATVQAPMSGRVSKKHYSVGDYVGPSSGTIAAILKFDPIRVVCSMSEVEYLNLMERSGSSPEKIFRPTLHLPNGSLYPGDGRWDFAGTEIDPSTGTIALRSSYANPDGLLIPGGYVTVVLSPIKGEKLPVVPQGAVNENKEGSFVYIVGEDNIAEMRFVRKRSVFGTDWIVEEGVTPGETIIIEGVQKVRPGQKVRFEQTPKISGGVPEAVSASGDR